MMRIHYSTSVGSNGGHPIFPDPFDQFGDPTDIGLPESGFAPARSTAGETGISSPHATAATAPTVYATATLTQVLYLQEAGNASLIAVSDINQGQIGDCFLLSSIGEVALWHPAAITNMIHDNANGTETVTLYLAATGQLPSYGTTAFEATSVTVNNTFPSNAVNNGASSGCAQRAEGDLGPGPGKGGRDPGRRLRRDQQRRQPDDRHGGTDGSGPRRGCHRLPSPCSSCKAS